MYIYVFFKGLKTISVLNIYVEKSVNSENTIEICNKNSNK